MYISDLGTCLGCRHQSEESSVELTGSGSDKILKSSQAQSTLNKKAEKDSTEI